jgi:hypothetical protein
MKKQLKKLVLAKETVLKLESDKLQEVHGEGAATGTPCTDKVC